MSYQTPLAEAVSQQMLDITADALLTGKAEMFMGCFQVPHVIDTFDGQTTIETRDAFLKLFFKLVERYRKLGVTRMNRSIVECDLVRPDLIVLVHESRFMNDSILLTETSTALSYVQRFDDTWKIVRTHYAIPAHPALNTILSGRDDD